MAVMLLSGGLDSTVLAYYLKNLGLEVVALSFDYGQRHRKEINYAKRTANRLGFDHEVIELPKGVLKSSALVDSDLPKGFDPFDEIQKVTIVPNRNMIMLSIAVGYALSRNHDEVYIAVHKDDWEIYPDCRPEFYRAMNLAVMLGNEMEKDVIQTPFINMYRWEIVRLGKELHVPFDETWTCYEGREKPCEECAACLERKMAFDLAGDE